MKEIYTQHTLNEFFEEFKNLPNSYKIEQVHQLLNNPNAMATHKVISHFKHLKLIIMTSAFIMGVSAVLLWFTPNESVNKSIITENHPIHVDYENQDENDKLQISNSKSNNIEEKRDIKKIESLNNDTKSIKKNENNSKKTLPITQDKIIDSIPEKNCNWPLDTVLNKNNLYIYLSIPELKNLGVNLAADSMFYSNTTPDKRHSGTTSINWKTNRPSKTNFDFHMVYNTDTACTRYRWGHKFYSEVDTLVPVVIEIGNENNILWFTPQPSFFKSLPQRYQYLESVFNDLICAKKHNPSHQFVNHWRLENNIVLDKINFLDLPIETLKQIGFQVFEDSISLVHPNQSMFYNSGKYMSYIGTKGVDSIPFPPNPLPVIVTDVKGLKQNYFGHGKKNDFEISMFDILVPVRIPLNEIISSFDYYLVFWFYPTDEFIDALPEEIKNDLKSERNEILNMSLNDEKSCTYFEVCKSTLKLDNFKLYPNPANYSVTIEFDINEEVEGSISIVNIAGARLKTLVPNSTFQSGQSTYQMDLSGITPGIYLISINTDKGFKTQRLIVSQ